MSRIIAISDIHGGCHLLERVLKEVSLTPDDCLVIMGDFIQRGPCNINTLEMIKSLSIRPNTIVLSGNHEHYIQSLLKIEYVKQLDYHLNHIHYGCIIREWIHKYKIKYNTLEDLQGQLSEHCKDDLMFLRNLPKYFIKDQHIFVHAGVNGNLSESSDWDLLTTPEFYLKSHQEDHTIVVGHWPVQNYKKASLSGDYLHDKEKRIIAIDGGYGVKSHGQLNALIVDEGYECIVVDDLEEIHFTQSFEPENHDIVKLDYDDQEFRIIKKETPFSIVEKNSTNEKFKIINDFLEGDFEDYISLFLSVNQRDTGKYIKSVGGYSLIKLNGQVGWVPSHIVKKK